MTSREEAISITKSFFLQKEVYKGYIIDQSRILERETLWYVPIKSVNPTAPFSLIGAWPGLIVDKGSADHFQPGSRYRLEEWMYGFSIGLRTGRYDLKINKINSHERALDILKELRLQFVKIEVDGGRTWKIPRDFKPAQIEKRLMKLPCVFKNQSFIQSIKQFRKIKEEQVFEYELLKTRSTYPKVLGELMED